MNLDKERDNEYTSNIKIHSLGEAIYFIVSKCKEPENHP